MSEDSPSVLEARKLNMMLSQGFIPTGPQGQVTKVTDRTAQVIRDQLAGQGVDLSHPIAPKEPEV